MDSEQGITLEFEPMPINGAETEARQEVARSFSGAGEIGQLATKQPEVHDTLAPAQTIDQEPLSSITEIQRIGKNIEALRIHAKAA